MGYLDVTNSVQLYKIGSDVTYGRLRTSGKYPIKHAGFVAIPYTTHTFYSYSTAVHYLPEVTLPVC